LNVKINKEWFEELSSAAPVPGGGGASAMGGAAAASLGMMVANLTIGKKKYAEVEEDVKVYLTKLEGLRDEMLELIEADAKCFEPLAKAYSLPSSTEDEKSAKDKVMEVALVEACSVPLKIMQKGHKIITCLEELSEKGSVLAISDVAVGVEFVRTAVLGASMNVYINTKIMKDRELAQKYNDFADKLNAETAETADAVFEKIKGALKCQ